MTDYLWIINEAAVQIQQKSYKLFGLVGLTISTTIPISMLITGMLTTTTACVE